MWVGRSAPTATWRSQGRSFWKPDANGHVKEYSETKPGEAIVNSDLLLKYALTRRGLALDVAMVCSFEAHSLLVEALFDSMLAPTLPGYGRVSRNQLRNADVLIWRLIAKDCRDGLSWSPGGSPPFEAALKARLIDPMFRCALMPLPASSSSSASVPISPDVKSLEDENRELKRKLQNNNQQHDNGGGGGKAKRQRNNKGTKGGGKGKANVSMTGKTRTHTNGEPLCFNFNTRGCPNAKPGMKCKNGWHFCAEPGCGKAHAMKDNHN